MKVSIPVTVKQKFGSKARSEYHNFLQGNFKQIRGSAVLSGDVKIDGVVVGALVPFGEQFLTSIELNTQKLKELAEHQNLVSFEVDDHLFSA
ncbi:hypothetical protein C4588_04725 [Candidatus Parcubacteria bacterium]|nr:MAG: hypothetical protein C4588_04725 [Candidatus Parcubacteria bacterium]